MPVTEILYTCINREINIYKFHVKIKFSSKVIVHEIRGTNFWGTLYIVKNIKITYAAYTTTEALFA